ncbi:MAG: hypothetical protein D6715_09795 [Calditrichaeota bacterium]|nr:MAG: hypothetical protein D6715_09795 [Calditrichota bacterium]
MATAFFVGAPGIGKVVPPLALIPKGRDSASVEFSWSVRAFRGFDVLRGLPRQSVAGFKVF